MKCHTVNELIAALRGAAKTAPNGGEARVCVDDIEGNLGAYGPLEKIAVAYDHETGNVTILCNQFEH